LILLAVGLAGCYESSGFLSEDPLGYVAGINLYAYVYADPVSSKDPRGTYAHCTAVPDSILGVFDFTACCTQHDNCYSTCGSSKGACDGEFYKCMKAECARRGFARWNCLKVAEAYYGGVDNVGGHFYNKAQTESGCNKCKTATPTPTPVPPPHPTQ
jgi:hypothetical protein